MQLNGTRSNNGVSTREQTHRERKMNARKKEGKNDREKERKKERKKRLYIVVVVIVIYSPGREM
jgi:hypothetical protein